MLWIISKKGAGGHCLHFHIFIFNICTSTAPKYGELNLGQSWVSQRRCAVEITGKRFLWNQRNQNQGRRESQRRLRLTTIPQLLWKSRVSTAVEEAKDHHRSKVICKVPFSSRMVKRRTWTDAWTCLTSLVCRVLSADLQDLSPSQLSVNQPPPSSLSSIQKPHCGLSGGRWWAEEQYMYWGGRSEVLWKLMHTEIREARYRVQGLRAENRRLCSSCRAGLGVAL